MAPRTDDTIARMLAGCAATCWLATCVAGCGSLSRIPGDNLVGRSPSPASQLGSEQHVAPVIPATALAGRRSDAELATAGVVPASYAASNRRPDGFAAEGQQVDGLRMESPGVHYASCLAGCPAGTPAFGNASTCLHCGNPCQPAGPCFICGAAGRPYHDPSEYIFDGGDGQLAAVVRKDGTTAGVDPTDTVAYYETPGGQICVTPSNRVPIYAPRFAAVRKVTGVQLSARAVGTERMLAPRAAERFDDRSMASHVVQPVAPHGEAQVRLLDAFQLNQRGIPIEQILPLERMSEARVPHEVADFFRTGVIREDQLAVLGRIVQGALTWELTEQLGIAIKVEDVALTRDTQASQEFVVYKAPDGCSLRICKAASHTIADAGDIVRFTIRLDNVGVKPILKAVVLDSLSPRLGYIEGSQQSSFDVRFSATANEAGSSELRWELSSEIGPAEGGVITFDCRVR